MKKLFPILMIPVLLLAACAKEAAPSDNNDLPPKESAPDEGQNVFATLLDHASDRFLRVAGEKDYLIVNPSATDAFSEGTRVLASFQEESHFTYDPKLYETAVSILWLEAVDEEQVADNAPEITNPEPSYFGDSLQVIYDWITTAEAGYLTVHYRIRQSGTVRHRLELRPFGSGHDYALYHDRQGDTGEEPAEGILCFRLLPEPATEESLNLHYLDFSGKVKTLVLVYRNGS